MDWDSVLETEGFQYVPTSFIGTINQGEEADRETKEQCLGRVEQTNQLRSVSTFSVRTWQRAKVSVLILRW
jgi:hypothetical protein